MDQLLTMSKTELTRLEIMQRLKEKRVTHKEASRMLGLSTRQVKCLWRTYKRAGAQGLISQRRGKPSNNRIAREVVQQAIDLLHSRYSDFGPTLAHEKLTEMHGLQFSRESMQAIALVGWCS
jgi:hypothetical protein